MRGWIYKTLRALIGLPATGSVSSDVAALSGHLGTPAAGTLCSEVEAIGTAVAAIPTTDHFTLIPAEAAPAALDAAGGAAPSALVAIPAGAKSFVVGSINAARTAGLAGYAAASNSPRTHSGPATASLNDACFIPAHCEDGATVPTHVFVCNTDTVAGKFWVQFFK